MANYPSSLPSFTGQVGAQTDPMSAPRHDTHHTNQNGEIVAIATELGTVPKGGYGSVKDRLAASRRPRFKTGRWHFPHGTSYGDAFTPVQAVMIAHPMWFNGLKTFDRVGLNITTGGSVGSVLRLGVYRDDGDGAPGALDADWGTIAATASGAFDITISWTPTADLYWIAGCLQGAPATAPVLRAWQNINLDPVSAASLADANWGQGYGETGVTGAFPANFTTTLIAQASAFGILLRAA